MKFFSPVLLCLIIFFISCKKENSPLAFTAVSSDTEMNLYTVRKLKGDSLIACGGKDEKGILLFSNDKGNSWSILSESFDQVIYDIYFINDSLGFAAGGTPDVFKTIDRGLTWEKLHIPFPAFPLSYRVPLRRIFFVNDSLGFICGGGRYEAGIIFKTTDQGRNWSLSLFGHELRGILFSDEQNGYACGYGCIYKTTDSGDNWHLIDSPNEFYTSMIFSKNNIYASGYNGGIIHTSGENNEWKSVNSSNNAFSSRSHYNCLASDGNTILAAGNDGIISISVDNGNSWSEGKSFNESTIRYILMTGEHSGIAGGNDGKIFQFSF